MTADQFFGSNFNQLYTVRTFKLKIRFDSSQHELAHERHAVAGDKVLNA